MEKQNIKKLFWKIGTTVVITLTAVFTVWVYAAFVEPTAGPNSSDQDFAQNILGANNADNDFNSSLITANNNGSILERLEYMCEGLYTTECGESTTSTQTNCYVDDTVRYLTTDLCNEAKENQCFVPADNGYYVFGTECSDSTTSTQTNCYVDDTAKYVDSNACSAGSNSGYCYMNTANFSDMDTDLVASKIKNGVTIFGVSGTYASAESNPDYPDLMRIAAFTEPSAGPADFNQDFTQNILGANNADNDFDSSLVVASSTGSIIERLEYVTSRIANNNSARLFTSECGESTTSTQTNCYVDDTARYLTTDLCNEAKENQCFVPTDNGYYAFGTECSDSTTMAATNCYVDDTARYVDSNACSAGSNTGYCYMNTANFSDMDTDLVASNIKNGVIIFGITGTYQLANGAGCFSSAECISGFCVDGICCNNSCTGSTCQRCDSYSNAGTGTCGYVSSSAQDPDNECQGSTANDGCTSNTCSGSGYSCGVQTSGDGSCPVCGTCSDADVACEYYAAGTTDSSCSACKKCSGAEIGTCTTNTADTNWGANLYSCTGASTRCVSGGCRTCDSYLYSDSCSGCAGQGGNACWRYIYIGSGSCDNACSSYGGCIPGVKWNDDASCSVCKHFWPSSTVCSSHTYDYFPAWATAAPNYCYRRDASLNANCGVGGGGYSNYDILCVCQW